MASHYANLKKSERLQRIMKILRDRKEHTSIEISDATGSVAVHSDIHELRQNGKRVAPAKYKGLTSAGRKIYSYRMVRV